MTGTEDLYHIPSDVTVESTATGRRSTVGISEDLLAAVGQTEKSFDDQLRDIRASVNLPTKYTAGIRRSNLHKQLKATTETDSLLRGSTTSMSYGGEPNFNDDDVSLRTDEQSQKSTSTFGSTLPNSLPQGALPTEIIEAKISHDEPQPETLQQHDEARPETFPYSPPETDNEEGVPIDHLGCERLKMEIHKNLKLHRLASDCFWFRNFLLFQVPQAILAMASSILAFMGGSEISNAMSQKWFTTLAGCCSALVVFLQTLSGHCAYGNRASMHNSTTIYLRDLDDDLTLLMSKLMKTEMMEKQQEKKKKLQQHNQNNQEESFESLQSRYRHSLKGCKSDVPTQIVEAFSEIDSFIFLSRTTANRKYLRDCGMFEAQNFRGITLKCYDRLAANMVGYSYWPLKIPCSKTLVKKTIDETRSDLHEMNSFWETPPPKELSIVSLPFGNFSPVKRDYSEVYSDILKTT
jgi:Skp family chaperone for outer membrane proteins